MLKFVTKNKLLVDQKERDCVELRREIDALLKTLEHRKKNLNILQQKAQEQNFNKLSRKTELDAGPGLLQHMTMPTLQRISNKEENQEFEDNQNYTSNLKQLVADFTIFNGIDFTVEDYTIIGDSDRYTIHVTSGPVEVYVQFIWNETSQKCLNINVSFINDDLSLFHKQELASRINKCVRDSNLVKLIDTITQYSELYVIRENVCKKLSKIEELSKKFKFYKIIDPASYTIEILDKHTGLGYIKANWTIKYFKARYVMDHAFNITVNVRDEELGQQQKALLVQLTKREDFSVEEIVEIFTQLTKIS